MGRWIGWSLTFSLIVGLVIIASVRFPAPATDRASVAKRLNGKLVVGIDPSYPPFAVETADGGVAGFDVEFAAEVGKRLGVPVQFVGLDLGAIFDGLGQGRFDVVISAIPPYPEYARTVAYSQGYFNAGQTLIVPATMTGTVRVESLRGAIAVEIGAAGEIEARRLAARNRELTILAKDSPASAVAAVGDGRAVAALLDRVSAVEAARGIAAVRVVSPPITEEPYVVAARRADVGLLAEIDAIVSAMRSDGTLAALEAKWLNPTPTPTPARPSPTATPPRPTATATPTRR